MTILTLLLSFLFSLLAQADSTIFLESNLAAVLRLTGDGTFAAAYYDSSGGETVTIRAESAGEPLDLVLELLGADGQTIAYVDAPELSAPVISRERLESAGRYTVRVNTFNGEGIGDVHVTLTIEPPYVLTPDAPSLRVALGANDAAQVSLDGFDLSQPLTISVSDPTGQLDAQLAIIDAGTVLATNDDHTSTDPSLNRFDAQLTTTLPDGAVLQITDFLGRTGWFTVSIRP